MKLLDAAGVASRSGDGGGHGDSGDMEMDRGGHGSGEDRETDGGGHGCGDGNESGGHGSGEREERSGHNQGQGSPAAPFEPGLVAVAAQVVTFTIVESRVVGRA